MHHTDGRGLLLHSHTWRGLLCVLWALCGNGCTNPDAVWSWQARGTVLITLLIGATWRIRLAPMRPYVALLWPLVTNQPPLSSIKSRRLTVSGHVARMDENADASQAILEPAPENWRRPPGRPRTTWMKNIHDDLSSLDLGIHEARDLVQNRPLCRLMSLHSATHS